jgi:putative acetyltransferase
MKIRRERPADAAAIREIHEAAFGRRAEAVLVDRLRADGDVIPALSLVAELDGAVAGHVLGSRARLGELASVGLGPLGVLPERQRAGVGTALVYAFLAAADALELPEVVLLGDPAYYRRFGFELARPLGVTPPVPEWEPHFQLRRLARWSAQRAGAFRYAPAFDGV